MFRNNETQSADPFGHPGLDVERVYDSMAGSYTIDFSPVDAGQASDAWHWFVQMPLQPTAYNLQGNSRQEAGEHPVVLRQIEIRPT